MKQIKLSASSGVAEIAKFVISTFDGWFLIAISLFFFVVGVASIFGFLSFEIQVKELVAVFMYPLLLLVVFVRQRINTISSDVLPAIMSIISLLTLSAVPFFLIFLR